VTPEAQAQLEQRVGNGTAWLAQHDPGSRFHAWFQAGLNSLSILPAHEATPEVREQWLAYYPQRILWEKLERQLSIVEERERQQPQVSVIPWVGERGPLP
jgi:hypothetical protein